MAQTQAQVVRDEDLLPEEREWLFGSDGNKETADGKFWKILHIANKVMAGILIVLSLYGGQVFEPSSNTRPEVPVQTK